jgi:hypothetical protein
MSIYASDMASDSLGEDGDHVALCEVEMQPANEDVRGVLVFIVPGSAAEPEVELGLVYLVDFLDDTGRVSMR